VTLLEVAQPQLERAARRAFKRASRPFEQLGAASAQGSQAAGAGSQTATGAGSHTATGAGSHTGAGSQAAGAVPQEGAAPQLFLEASLARRRAKRPGLLPQLGAASAQGSQATGAGSQTGAASQAGAAPQLLEAALARKRANKPGLLPQLGAGSQAGAHASAAAAPQPRFCKRANNPSRAPQDAAPPPHPQPATTLPLSIETPATNNMAATANPPQNVRFILINPLEHSRPTPRSTVEQRKNSGMPPSCPHPRFESFTNSINGR
jgi:hypothetical protein